MTDTRAAGPAANGSRPRPNGRARAELTETPAGWVLTLVVDARTAERVQDALADGSGPKRVLPADFRVAVTPNLVPGTPFVIDAIELMIEDSDPEEVTQE